MRLVYWLLALMVLLLSVRYLWAFLLLTNAIWWTITRLAQTLLLVMGSGSFWWVLRSYQLQKEQELLDQALLKFKYYTRYRNRGSSGNHSGVHHKSSGTAVDSALSPPNSVGFMTDAGFQLRVLKRLPIVAHLRTSWSLPPEICDEVAALVQSIVKNYITDWFQFISLNDEFPNDVRFLLADLLGAVVSRVLEIDSSQALTMLAKSFELLRLHLGWFREAYAQLADEYPAVFEGDENDGNLLKRQEYVTAFVQRSPFVHPGCAEMNVPKVGHSGGQKYGSDTAESAYLRHVATQLLTQLKPQLGQLHSANVFVSIATNLLREVTAFKILKPLSEYSQPRYSNEIVLSCLQSFVDDKNGHESLSPTAPSSGNGVGVPSLTLNKLRSTSSFLYKASKRSSEQAEAAFQAVVDAVASAASSAAAGAAGAAEMVFDAEDWTDGNNLFAFGNPVLSANSNGLSSDRKAMTSMFTLDDRVNVAKAAKMIDPRGFISLSQKISTDNSRISAHMDDLKHAKANIGSTLNVSLGKVKRRFRTLGGQQLDPTCAPPLSSGAGAAARMIRKPGQLLQKAWKRGESGSNSPVTFYDDGMGTTAGGQNNLDVTGSVNSLLSPMSYDGAAATPTAKVNLARDRVISHFEKAVANYTKMYDECPEMRNSVRSRELYDLLFAMESVFMLGFRNRNSKLSFDDEIGNEEPATPPNSPNVNYLASLEKSQVEQTSPFCDSIDTNTASESDGDSDDSQYYWEFLAQDRPGADSFNEHWRFVASQCPDCRSSESFISTRGVQWLLVALGKGSLGTFCAEAYAHSYVTDIFYDSSALLFDSRRMEAVVQTLSQLDKFKVYFDMPLVLGEKGQNLDNLPSNRWLLHGLTSPSAPVRVLERVWETERYVPMNGWIKGTDKRCNKLPSSEWIWEGDWTLEIAEEDAGESTDSDTLKSSWEYAKTFEDNFHEKEKKFDLVRRRQWIRQRCQLPPVLTLASPPSSPSTFNVSSPLSSSTVPNGIGRARKLKQRFNALKFDTKKDMENIAKMAMRSRHSKSFDRKTPDGPVGTIDLDESYQISAKMSAFTKARAAIPSLRRGVSNRSVNVEVQSPSIGLSADNDSPTLYDNEEDDDENLCFRCLKLLPSLQSSVKTCKTCRQRVCSSCLNYYAFVVYPPPLETSKKASVCGTCYDRLVNKYKLRIDANVGKYLIKERDVEIYSSSNGIVNNSPHHAPSGGKLGNSKSSQPSSSPSSPHVSPVGSNKFEITVKVKDDTKYAWSVVKTFHDFEVLEKDLKNKLKKQEKKYGVGCRACHLKGVDYMEMVSIQPSLKTVSTAALTYDQRLHVIKQFLQQLLACDTLCQSSVVQKFLLLENAYATPLAASNSSMYNYETNNGLHSSLAGTGTLGIVNDGASSGLIGAANVLVENGKWKKGRWIAPDSNSKETKMRVLQKIEVSLFAVLGELLEFDGIGLVRRQLFSMTRSFIKAFLNASHFRMLERQFLSFTDPKKLSGWIGDLRLYIFPTKTDVVPTPEPDIQVLRKECLEAILASFPSKALSLFGDTACENAALKLHEFLQHEVFVKNLLFSITDELLLHLFPNSTTFKGKKKQRNTSAGPTPSSPSAIAVATTIAKETVSASIDEHAAWNVTPPMSPIVAAEIERFQK
ncbi:tectonin beta-propeller repeat-containing [Plasmopara halstedii]|uniref:Tectonin beta-propeller repeat-containing n=1 Tax=Plasmopara halstedii TaxID=4781 RepID=A0A0P1AJE6_PLAHL|nr:tectonin beta-propeller repeat-containing [Plasmopara halstedii]CEG41080.1 tectonin beta-propeller repeat-containing [Plasmopara halstedii]|eukprot:XP_024577449.1 tectonin beta-propeller repeat-containing [Plasmopara halstedii]